MAFYHLLAHLRYTSDTMYNALFHCPATANVPGSEKRSTLSESVYIPGVGLPLPSLAIWPGYQGVVCVYHLLPGLSPISINPQHFARAHVPHL